MNRPVRPVALLILTLLLVPPATAAALRIAME